MTRAREVFDRLGTPDSVSWPAFWATLFANALVSFASGMDVQASLLLRVIVLVASQAGAIGFLVLFRRVVLDRSDGRPHSWLTVLAFAVAGALRGLIAGGLLVAVVGAPTSVLGYRIAAGVALYVAVLVPTALIVSTARTYRRARRLLLARDVQLRAARTRVVEEIEERDAEVVARVESQLTEALTGDAPEEQARRLEKVAADVIRPLSHELALSQPNWRPPPAPETRVRLGAILDRATSGRPLMPLSTSLAGGILFAGYAVDHIGVRVIPGFAAYVVLSWAVLWLGNGLLGLVPARLPLLVRLVAVLAVLAVAGLLMGVAMTWGLGDYGRANLVAAIPVLYCLFGLTLALALAGDRELQASLADLERADVELTWQLKRINMQQWQRQRALSRALHGPVQSAIAASVERLRAGGRDETALMRAEMLSALAPAARGLSGPCSHGLVQLAATWRGVCAVHVSDKAQVALLDADPACAEMALEIVSEAVSNAVRHGRARTAEVTIAVGSDAAEVRVIDDGSGAASASAGLGTRLLEDCALAWDRSPTDGLVASLPWNP